MGDYFVRIYREKVKATWKLAFSSAFLLGLLIHLYKFTNILPVADSLYNLYNSQNMVQSGRWFLAVACSFSSFFDLPWITGLFSVFFMALTAVVITEVFEMKNPCLIVVSGGLLVSFPSIYSALSYGFTADGYMIAMFLSALSVQLTKMSAQFNGRERIYRVIFGTICICLSCGIYQAYVSFSYILAICYFLMELLRNNRSAREYTGWIVSQIVMYVTALAAYYIIWKLCLHVQGYSVTSYQGMDRIGLYGGRSLTDTIIAVLYSFAMFFLEGNPMEYGLTNWSALCILTIAAFAIGFCIAFFRSGCAKRKLHTVLCVLCLISIPFGCCILMFTSEQVFYHALMMQSVCVLFIFTGVIWEAWCKPRGSTAVWVLLCAVVFNNGVTANIHYKHLDESFKRTQALAAEVNTRIHLIDDGTIRNVAIVGTLDGFGEEALNNDAELRGLGPWKTVCYTLLTEQFLSTYTDFDLAYYRENGLEYPKVTYSSEELPFPRDYVFYFPMLSEEDEAKLTETETFKAMPVWPAAGSVQAVGDTVVIKLSDV